jgi:hypothetical protein
VKDLFMLGLRELQQFQNRVRRLYAMGRLPREDFEILEDKVTELITMVEAMRMRDADYQEAFR